MADLSVPFLGLPNETRRADKARANRAKTYEDTWLDSFIKGMFGAEQPTGSIFDQNRPEKVQANSAGQALGIGSDLFPGKAPLTAAKGLALAGAVGHGVPKISHLLSSSPANPLDQFVAAAKTAPWDESRRAYNIPTTDAVSEAINLVGPAEYRRLAKAHAISNDSPEWSAISNEMVARQIIDFYERQGK